MSPKKCSLANDAADLLQQNRLEDFAEEWLFHVSTANHDAAVERPVQVKGSISISF